MGAGGSHVWSEASWDEAMKQEGLAESMHFTTNNEAEKILLTENSAARVDKLFLSQVANKNDVKLEDVHHAIDLVIGYAKTNLEDPRSGVLLCRSLHAVCVFGVGASHRKSCQQKIMKEGGVAMIIEVLKQKESILSQRHSLAALSAVLCRNLSVQRMAIDLGIIDACSNVMKEAAFNADTTGSGELAVIAERGCLVFTALCAGNPEGKTALLKKTGPSSSSASYALSSIIDVMEAFLPAAAVQLAGCICLATLSRGDAKHKERVALSGGLGRIVAAMNFHSEVASVQKEACKALANLVSQSAEAKQVAASQGCIECILDCIDSFMGAAQVVEPALFALSNFCCGPSTSSSSTSSSSMVTGGGGSSANRGSMINRAPSGHNKTSSPSSSSRSLSKNSPSIAPHVMANAIAAVSQAAARRTTIVNGGGIDLILGAMRVHVREHPGIAHAGCCALGALGGGSNHISASPASSGHHTSSTPSSPNKHHKKHSSMTPNSRPSSPKSNSNAILPRSPSSSKNHHPSSNTMVLSFASPSKNGDPSSPFSTPNKKNNINSSSSGFSNQNKTSPFLSPSSFHGHNENFLIENIQQEFSADTIRENIRKEGGLRAVVDAMLFHPSKLLVQLHGCLALSILWKIPSSSKNHVQGGGGIGRPVFTQAEIESKREQKLLDTQIEAQRVSVVPDAVKVINLVLQEIHNEQFASTPDEEVKFGGGGSSNPNPNPSSSSSSSSSSTIDLTKHIPLAQAACLAVSTLSKAQVECRLLFAKMGVVELLANAMRVFAISGGKVPKIRAGSDQKPSIDMPLPTSTTAPGSSANANANANVNAAQTPPISSVGSPIVAVAALDAIGVLASLGCGHLPTTKEGNNVGGTFSSFDLLRSFDSTTGSVQDLYPNENKGVEVQDSEIYFVSNIKAIIPLVITTMRAHLSQVEVQKMGCLALEGIHIEAAAATSRALSSDNNKNNPSPLLLISSSSYSPSQPAISMSSDIYDIISRSGGLDVIHEARRYHPSQTTISRVAHDAVHRNGKWK
mmetsp:Transcript_25081/g.29663  ORF Transcript_25081/g.29663 Transcript_25081/m.29663 type:complete len:1026 (+) Transcript_25081:91-3168(+)